MHIFILFIAVVLIPFFDVFICLVVSFDCEFDFLNGNVTEVLGSMSFLNLDSDLSWDPLIVISSVGDIRSREELGRLLLTCYVFPLTKRRSTQMQKSTQEQ